MDIKEQLRNAHLYAQDPSYCGEFTIVANLHDVEINSYGVDLERFLKEANDYNQGKHHPDIGLWFYHKGKLLEWDDFVEVDYKLVGIK